MPLRNTWTQSNTLGSTHRRETRPGIGCSEWKIKWNSKPSHTVRLLGLKGSWSCTGRHFQEFLASLPHINCVLMGIFFSLAQMALSQSNLNRCVIGIYQETRGLPKKIGLGLEKQLVKKKSSRLFSSKKNSLLAPGPCSDSTRQRFEPRGIFLEQYSNLVKSFAIEIPQGPNPQQDKLFELTWNKMILETMQHQPRSKIALGELIILPKVHDSSVGIKDDLLSTPTGAPQSPAVSPQHQPKPNEKAHNIGDLHIPLNSNAEPRASPAKRQHKTGSTSSPACP